MSDEATSILSNAAKAFSTFTPALTALSITGAFWYEVGFSRGIGLPIQNMLDIPDLLRTSVLVLPFIALACFLGWLPTLIDGIKHGVIEQSQIQKSVSGNRWFFWLTVMIGALDFIHFALLGSSGGFRPWMGVMVVGSTTFFVGKLLKRLDSNFSVGLVSIACVTFFCVAFLKGNSDAFGAINRDRVIAYVTSNDFEGVLVRRFSSHLVISLGQTELALAEFDSSIVFRWNFEPRNWRGLLCAEPPLDTIGTLSSERCMSEEPN